MQIVKDPQQMTIEIITTGGTIDKLYNPLDGYLSFTSSFLPTMLDQANHQLDVMITPLFAVDSLDMTDSHRKKLLDHIIQSPYEKILITHGTDTMPETAEFLKANVTDKTIVLTGAMIPYNVANSDALFNLGSALMALQLQAQGVHIVIQGKAFLAGNVKKDRQAGRFIEK